MPVPGTVPGRPVLLPPEWVAAASAPRGSGGYAGGARRGAPAPSSYAPFPQAGGQQADGPLSRLRLFAGTSNPTLGAEVASYLGLDLGKIKVKRFADGETYVQVQESIRGW